MLVKCLGWPAADRVALAMSFHPSCLSVLIRKMGIIVETTKEEKGLNGVMQPVPGIQEILSTFSD